MSEQEGKTWIKLNEVALEGVYHECLQQDLTLGCIQANQQLDILNNALIERLNLH